MSKPRRLARRLLALLVGTAVPLAMAELLLRVADPFHNRVVLEREQFMQTVMERDAQGSWALRPGATGALFGHEIRINEQGLRGRPLTPKPAGTYRILVLGDSVAFGWGVAEADMMSAQLERMLADRELGGRKRVEVLCAATPGWGLPHYLQFLRTHPDVGADLVVLTLINNDVTDIADALLAQKTGRADDRRPAPPGLAWSYLARALTSALGRSGDADFAASGGDLFDTLESSRQWPSVIAAATTLLKDIRSSCTPGRLVVQDTLVLMDADGRPARRLQSLADALETAGIERFDGSIARPDYTERYALSPVDHHPNAAGHGDLARLAFDWVVAHVSPGGK